MSTIHSVFRSDRTCLSKLMNVDKGTKNLWQPVEFGEFWHQQLDTPLEYNLTIRIKEATNTYAGASATSRTPPRTFRELLTGPHPPIELLKLVKDFAKRHAKTEDGRLPEDVASMLYFASIAVALVRCGERISRLNDDKLRKGAEWALDQSWLDEATRLLFVKARELV
ncbi:MAG TPA: hypothetical protein VNU68_04615 [Verrucomicrobiae bacterium]|nr:hypothetical protein [Verrucomicrobiae bacterium]